MLSSTAQLRREFSLNENVWWACSAAVLLSWLKWWTSLSGTITPKIISETRGTCGQRPGSMLQGWMKWNYRANLRISVKSNDQFQSWPTASREQNTKWCLNSYHELDRKIVMAHSEASGSNSSSHNIDEQNQRRASCRNTNSWVHVSSKLLDMHTKYRGN